MPTARKLAVDIGVFLSAKDQRRHPLELTRLFQLVERCYPVFRHPTAKRGRRLLCCAQEKLAVFLQCARPGHGLSRVRYGALNLNIPCQMIPIPPAWTFLLNVRGGGNT
ncbi:hypothetical protein SAMN05216210_0967 [Halopseudomonas salegens]|uniref:Transposase n=1 Tax=Halopseudomonas salegens TaxID=1434072 RepID=A0A1H2EQZ3_9GAMM|nr:hypothetical protein SAMN05216210_0967 [Halopseudomonas salegens]